MPVTTAVKCDGKNPGNFLYQRRSRFDYDFADWAHQHVKETKLIRQRSRMALSKFLTFIPFAVVLNANWVNGLSVLIGMFSGQIRLGGRHSIAEGVPLLSEWVANGTACGYPEV